jgi:FAD/FMN-containing dehydrogenase
MTGFDVLVPADQEFGAAVPVWNAAVTHRPVAVARCRSVAEVRAAVLAAREVELPLGVRGGGHDWAGRALRDGGVLLDLSGMRDVTVDLATSTVTVGGGALAGDVTGALRPHELVVPTGTVRAVGMAGLTLAGGYGPLCGRYGLALDNLVRAELVLADGTAVTASTAEEPELFWAIRGGGGNFGVVTSLTYRAHHLPTVLAGMIMYPLAQAPGVLRGYRELVATAPDDLTVMTGFLPTPDGPVVFVCPLWSGPDLAAGQRLFDGLARLGDPLLDQAGTSPYHDALGMFDGAMVDGNHYYLGTRWLAELSPPAADALLDAAGRSASPYSAVSTHHFHGAATRVAPDATAFGLRTDHIVVEVVGAWAPDADPVPPHDWVDGTVAALDPLALPGGYPNLLGPEDADRLPAAYAANWPRLLDAKHRYDPDAVFSAVPTL